MEYHAESDIYICRNAKKLTADHIKHSKSRTGCVSKKIIYKCKDCSRCPYKSECIKGNHCKTPLEERTKILQAAKTFLKYRQEDLERILTDEDVLFKKTRAFRRKALLGI